MQGPGTWSTLPADWYLPALLSLTVLTNILRFAQYSGHMSSLFFEEIYCFFLKKCNLNTPPGKSIFFEYIPAFDLSIPTLPLLCYRNTADVYPVM